MACSSETVKVIECSICLNEIQQPCLLPCGHSFCKDCLKQVSQYFARVNPQNPQITRCSICRKTHVVPAQGFPTNFQLQDLLEQCHRSNLISDIQMTRKQMVAKLVSECNDVHGSIKTTAENIFNQLSQSSDIACSRFEKLRNTNDVPNENWNYEMAEARTRMADQFGNKVAKMNKTAFKLIKSCTMEAEDTATKLIWDGVKQVKQSEIERQKRLDEEMEKLKHYCESNDESSSYERLIDDDNDIFESLLSSELIACQRCNKQLDNPGTLSCGHALCGNCIKRLGEDADNSGLFSRPMTITCPTCNRDTTISFIGLPVSNTLKEMVEKISTAQQMQRMKQSVKKQFEKTNHITSSYRSMMSIHMEKMKEVIDDIIVFANENISKLGDVDQRSSSPISTEELRTKKDEIISSCKKCKSIVEDAHSKLDGALRVVMEHVTEMEVMLGRSYPNCRGAKRKQESSKKLDYVVPPPRKRKALNGTIQVEESVEMMVSYSGDEKIPK